jgi:hypothetical protein
MALWNTYLIGDMIRYTVGPLFGAALLPLAAKGMFSPLPVPKRFTKGFPDRLPLRPSQIRAEARDTAAMAFVTSLWLWATVWALLRLRFDRLVRVSVPPARRSRSTG